MRIAIISRFPREIDHPRGGVETATVGLTRALVSAGQDDVHVVTLDKEVKEVERESQEGIEVHRLQRSRWPMMLDIFGGPTAKRLQAYLQDLQPDVVHFQETWGLGASRYSFASVFTVHGFDSLNLPTERPGGWWIRSILWKRAEAWGMRKQRYVVSIAPYVRRMMENRTGAQIFDIWNSLDRRYFELERNEEPGAVVFLGWINPRKNPIVLVKVAALLKEEFPGVRIQLCGEESDPAYAREVRDLIASTGVSELVSLVGRLSQSEVLERIQKASLLVLPSLQENAPMVIAEAMAAGVPVIASNLCGIPDMVSDGDSGYLIEPFDVDGIAEKVGFLLRDDQARSAMGARAREEAIARYHPESVAKATLEVYERVCGLACGGKDLPTPDGLQVPS